MPLFWIRVNFSLARLATGRLRLVLFLFIQENMPADTFQELDFCLSYNEKKCHSPSQTLSGSVFDAVLLYFKWPMNMTKMLYCLQSKIKLSRYRLYQKNTQQKQTNQNQSTIKNNWKMFTKLALLSHIWEIVFDFSSKLQALLASRISKGSASGWEIGQVSITFYSSGIQI